MIFTEAQIFLKKDSRYPPVLHNTSTIVFNTDNNKFSAICFVPKIMQLLLLNLFELLAS